MSTDKICKGGGFSSGSQRVGALMAFTRLRSSSIVATAANSCCSSSFFEIQLILKFSLFSS